MSSNVELVDHSLQDVLLFIILGVLDRINFKEFCVRSILQIVTEMILIMDIYYPLALFRHHPSFVLLGIGYYIYNDSF